MTSDSLISDSDRESILSLKSVTYKPRRNSTAPKYICSICNANFKRLDQLDRHEFHHTGVKKHACFYDDCDKVYSILTHLKRHVRSTHERTNTPKKDIPCTIDDCNKMFHSESNMQRHIREVHENPKVYHCGFCDERFTHKLKLRRHEIKKHTGEYPYSCQKCSKGFYQKWQCEKHEPSCKVYNCPGCDEKFDKWSNYIKHSKETQHGRKYYKCEHCSRMYGKPGELQRHIVAKHMTEGVKMSFKCTQEGCTREYAYERNLRQHIKTAHSGKRFQCESEGCERDFSSAQNLAKHIQRDHTKRKRPDSSVCTDDDKKNHTKPASNKRPRKKRKDANKPMISGLSYLSGLAVQRDVDKFLRNRESDALETISSELAKNAEIDSSESEIEGDAQKSIFGISFNTTTVNEMKSSRRKAKNPVKLVETNE